MIADRLLQFRIDPRDPRSAVRFADAIGSNVLKTPSIAYSVTAEGDPAANTRRFTIQVTDLLGQSLAGRWLLMVYIATAEDGDQSAAGNTVTFPTGFVVATFEVNAAYLVRADTNGIVRMDLEVVGAGSRYIYTELFGANGLPIGSGEAVWT